MSMTLLKLATERLLHVLRGKKRSLESRFYCQDTEGHVPMKTAARRRAPFRDAILRAGGTTSPLGSLTLGGIQPMSTPEGDRRQAPRVSTDLQGTLGSGEAVTCNVVNLSKTGALAVSSQPFDEMSVVQISVSVKNDDGQSEDFACEAAVVRCAPRPDGRHDLGLYFTAVPDAARAVLNRIIESGSILPV
ncbi:MAG: PilZ domain-containing protein [Planctomycetota bacterium]|nr:PilZ domain-containing protein [Planctomycetota bacterium]